MVLVPYVPDPYFFSPAPTLMSFADIWGVDQGTDLDESHFSPRLVYPVEQLCGINKSMCMRNSMGKKALRSVSLSKTLY